MSLSFRRKTTPSLVESWLCSHEKYVFFMSSWECPNMTQYKQTPKQELGRWDVFPVPCCYTALFYSPLVTLQIWVLMKHTELKASGRKWLSSPVGRGWTRRLVSGHCTASTCPGHPAPFWRFRTRCEVGGCRVRCSRWCGWRLAEPQLARTPVLRTHSRWRHWAARLWICPWEWPSCDSLWERKRGAISRGTKTKDNMRIGAYPRNQYCLSLIILKSIFHIAGVASVSICIILYLWCNCFSHRTPPRPPPTQLKKTWWPRISARD